MARLRSGQASAVPNATTLMICHHERTQVREGSAVSVRERKADSSRPKAGPPVMTISKGNRFITYSENNRLVSGHGFSRAERDHLNDLSSRADLSPRGICCFGEGKKGRFLASQSGDARNDNSKTIALLITAKTTALYQGTALQAAENVGSWLCFVSGHGFSRAVRGYHHQGFSPCKPLHSQGLKPNPNRR